MMKAWIIFREECEKVTRRSLVFMRMRKEPCGSRRDWYFLRRKLGKKKILDEAHTSR
jgi:hypothetical protein